MADTPRDSLGRRGFFRALRDWAVEETSALAEPILDDYIERFEPVLAQMAGPALVRPPGAIDERRFRETCAKCGKCVAACPENAILPASESLFSEIVGTPVILPRRRPCYECNPLHCVDACPSGALAPIAREALRLGTARVLTSMCFAHQGQVCDTCHAVCPHRGSAITMRQGLPTVYPEACTGCGLCEYACPAHPVAIRVETRR